MGTEIEATFLETEHDKLRGKLKELGAELVNPERLTQRSIYDYEDLRLDKQAAWIRVRDEGGKTTMCYKQRVSEEIDGMKEIEFEVSSYGDAKKFLEAAGLKLKAEQESKRETWKLGNCEIMLDTWPWIPPFVEVEGPNEENVKKTSEKLGLDWEEAVFDSVDAIYMKYFDVTRVEISTIPIKFGRAPAEIAKKRY